MLFDLGMILRSVKVNIKIFSYKDILF